MPRIKNIIFDLGGVIININYNLTVDAFKKLGIENLHEVFSQLKQTYLFDEYEMGKISSSEFRTQLLKFTTHKISAAEFDLAWNAMLLDVPKERIDLLGQLNKHYNLVVLSNTNEIHIQEFSNILQLTHGFRDLSHLFTKLYYSFEIGSRKPNENSFSYVLANSSFLAEETLFIDDSFPNIKAAHELGIHTLHLQPGYNINQVFTESFMPKMEFMNQLPII